MARPKSKGAYVPLAAQYFMDDAVLEAGPDAELLFVRILSFLASIPSDGFITDRQIQIVASGLRAPQRRLDSLLNVGLIERVSGGFLVRSWLKWNRSADEVGKLLAKDRERKARKNAEDADNSARNPGGIRVDSSPQSRAEQSSTEQNPPKPPRGGARGDRIPEPFMLTAEMRNWAAENTPSVNVNQATAEFVDYWRGVPGVRGRKLDWTATWRNRMRDVAGRRQTFGQQKDDNALALIAALKAEEDHAAIGNGSTSHLRVLGSGG